MGNNEGDNLRGDPRGENGEAARGSGPADSPALREGWYHYNKRFSEEFFQQLTVEQVTVTWEKGQEVKKYVNPQKARNEALDIEVGNLAAFRLGVQSPQRLEALEAELQAQVAAQKQTAQPVFEPAPSRQRENSNWMGGMGRGFRV